MTSLLVKVQYRNGIRMVPVTVGVTTVEELTRLAIQLFNEPISRRFRWVLFVPGSTVPLARVSVPNYNSQNSFVLRRINRPSSPVVLRSDSNACAVITFVLLAIFILAAFIWILAV